MADYKTKGNLKALIVTGCLAQRYKEEITKEIPEVDAVLGTNSQAALLDAVDEALKGKVSHVFTPLEGIPQMPGKRMITTGGFYEYLEDSRRMQQTLYLLYHSENQRKLSQAFPWKL